MAKLLRDRLGDRGGQQRPVSKNEATRRSALDAPPDVAGSELICSTGRTTSTLSVAGAALSATRFASGISTARLTSWLSRPSSINSGMAGRMPTCEEEGCGRLAERAYHVNPRLDEIADSVIHRARVKHADSAIRLPWFTESRDFGPDYPKASVTISSPKAPKPNYGRCVRSAAASLYIFDHGTKWSFVSLWWRMRH
jgi:hypothetical protein